MVAGVYRIPVAQSDVLAVDNDRMRRWVDRCRDVVDAVCDPGGAYPHEVVGSIMTATKQADPKVGQWVHVTYVQHPRGRAPSTCLLYAAFLGGKQVTRWLASNGSIRKIARPNIAGWF